MIPIESNSLQIFQEIFQGLVTSKAPVARQPNCPSFAHKSSQNGKCWQVLALLEILVIFKTE